jgi:phage portal protein BeeE
MSAMGNLILEIQEAIESGERSLEDIARSYNVPTTWVEQITADINPLDLDGI